MPSQDCLNFLQVHENMQANLLQNMENFGIMHGSNLQDYNEASSI